MLSRRAAWPDLVSDGHSGARAHHRGNHSRGEVAEVRGWIENYHKLKDHLEKISEINRE